MAQTVDAPTGSLSQPISQVNSQIVMADLYCDYLLKSHTLTKIYQLIKLNTEGAIAFERREWEYSRSTIESKIKETIVMPNVYVEPLPKGREGPIQGYALEYEGDRPVTSTTYKTQQEAIDAAKRLGHKPLVAHVRTTNKGKPDQWRHA